MTLIDTLRPEQRRQLRQMRYRIYNREYMRRIREQRKLLCVAVDLPISDPPAGSPSPSSPPGAARQP